SFFRQCCYCPLDPRSFPTRRSSDLRLGHVPDPVDVDPEDKVPGLDVQVLESNPAVDAGIVVQDIDPAVLLDDIVHRLLDLVQLADRKSTRLNSSHVSISYAVFCLKK